MAKEFIHMTDESDDTVVHLGGRDACLILRGDGKLEVFAPKTEEDDILLPQAAAIMALAFAAGQPKILSTLEGLVLRLADAVIARDEVPPPPPDDQGGGPEDPGSGLLH